MKKQKYIKITNSEGKEQEYAILSTFEYKKRKIILYTDYSTDDSNNIKVYSGIYDNEGIVEPIIRKEDEIIVSHFVKYLENGLKSNTLI